MQAYLVAADSGDGSGPAWVALTVAVLALLGVLVTAAVAAWQIHRTRQTADEANRTARDALNETQTQHRREEWWKRSAWAMERACDHAAGSVHRKVAIAILDAMAESPLAHQTERDMIKSVTMLVLGAP